MSFQDISAAAQTAYSNLSQALVAQRVRNCAALLPGGFATKNIRGRSYWYYQLKSPGGQLRQFYVGPDNEEVRSLVQSHREETQTTRPHLSALARSCAALGCPGMPAVHYRVIERMAEHGVFEAGAMLVGTHAFLAYQNHFGVYWKEPFVTSDIDFAHPGKNVSVALVQNAKSDARTALESLQMGFAPISGGATFKNPHQADFDIDFLTSKNSSSDDPVECEALNVRLQPLRFMEFSLESPIQCAVLGASSATLVNLPAPERFAVHKLLVAPLRTGALKSKARKDLLQVMAVMNYCLQRDPDSIAGAWRDASRRGPSWKKSLSAGCKLFLEMIPSSQDLLSKVEELALKNPDASEEADTIDGADVVPVDRVYRPRNR